MFILQCAWAFWQSLGESVGTDSGGHKNNCSFSTLVHFSFISLTWEVAANMQLYETWAGESGTPFLSLLHNATSYFPAIRGKNSLLSRYLFSVLVCVVLHSLSQGSEWRSCSSSKVTANVVLIECLPLLFFTNKPLCISSYALLLPLHESEDQSAFVWKCLWRHREKERKQSGLVSSANNKVVLRRKLWHSFLSFWFILFSRCLVNYDSAEFTGFKRHVCGVTVSFQPFLGNL